MAVSYMKKVNSILNNIMKLPFFFIDIYIIIRLGNLLRIIGINIYTFYRNLKDYVCINMHNVVIY